jgi:hypothetical protein
MFYVFLTCNGIFFFNKVMVHIKRVYKKKAKRLALSSVIVAILVTFLILLQIATVTISNADFPSGTVIPAANLHNWKTFVENRYGFTLQYPDAQLVLHDDTEDNKLPIDPTVPEDARPNSRDVFFQTKGYAAPYFVYAVALHTITQENTLAPSPVSLWIFENKNNLSADDWYEQYDYYPFTFGTHIPATIEADKPIQEIIIDGFPGKYHLVVDKAENQMAYIYIPRKNYMMLLAVENKVVGRQILATVHFFAYM